VLTGSPALSFTKRVSLSVTWARVSKEYIVVATISSKDFTAAKIFSTKENLWFI
jgi:hypothetical protein